MVEPPSKGNPEQDAPQQVTRILCSISAEASLSAGSLSERNGRAAAELLPLVYADLRGLAAARMARLAPGQTLQATALVHEAYVQLVGSADPGWQGRAHFFGAAARAMRNILADHLKRKGRLKHGGHMRRIGEDTAALLTSEGPKDDVLEVEAALEAFERDASTSEVSPHTLSLTPLIMRIGPRNTQNTRNSIRLIPCVQCVPWAKRH
jgi:RNA polymerase sigma factor (TIGR02999 family)